MRAVDTNVLVRLITRDNLLETTLAEAFIKDGAWVQLTVLIETVWVLSAVYGVSAPDLVTVLEMLLDHKTLSVEHPDTIAEAVKLFREKPALGFSDCVILHSARRAGHVPLGTFDKKLAKIDGATKL